MEERSCLLKAFIREASIHARDCMFEDLPNGPTSKLLRLSSISKAVWQRNVYLFNLLVGKSELARQHLVLVGGEPRLVDSNVFEEQFREAKLVAAEGRRAEIKAEHTSGNRAGNEFDDSRKTARLNRSHALEKLWHPRAPALVLMGVRLALEEATELGICTHNAGESGRVDPGVVCPGAFISDDGFVNCIAV